jgi:hypothetical protein
MEETEASQTTGAFKGNIWNLIGFDVLDGVKYNNFHASGFRVNATQEQTHERWRRWGGRQGGRLNDGEPLTPGTNSHSCR